MKKSNNNTWKRIAAGALSLALVAGALPANVGGLLTGGKGINAHAGTPNDNTSGNIHSGNVVIAKGQECIDEPIYTFNATSKDDVETKGQYSFQYESVDVTQITKIEVLVDIESIADGGWACVEWGKDTETRHIEWMKHTPGIRKYTVEGDTIADATYGQVQIVGNAKLLGYNIYYGDTLAKSVHTYYNVDAPESITEGHSLETTSNDYGTVNFSQSDTHNNYLAKAKSGYKFDHWSYKINGTKHTDNGTPSDNGVSLSIPSTSNPTEVKALFTKKLTPIADDFALTKPANLNYTGSDKTATVAAAEGVTGMGTITVKYYSDEACTVKAVPNAEGTYYVGIKVAEGSDYAAYTGVIHDADKWKFTITVAPTLYHGDTDITVKQGETVLTPDVQTGKYAIENSDIPVTVSANHSLVFKNDENAEEPYIVAAPDATALAGGKYVYTLTGAQLSGDVTILDEFVTQVDEKDVKNIILTKYNGNSASVTLPANITEIANGAFTGNTNVVSVGAENVTTLKERAFENCENLTTLNFPKLKTVEGYALKGTQISELTVLSGGTIGSINFVNPWEDGESRNITILTDSETPTTRIYDIYYKTYFIEKGVEIEDSGATQPTYQYRMPDNYVIFDNLSEEPVYGDQQNPNEITGYNRTVDIVSTKGVNPEDYEPGDTFTFGGKKYTILNPTVTVIGSSKYAIRNTEATDALEPVEQGGNTYNIDVGVNYYLYTDDELLESDILDQKTSKKQFTTFGDYQYKNRYVLSLTEGGQFKVAREYVGEVKEDEPATLYIGGQTAATLKANRKLYYGDQINESLVTINPLFKDVVKADSVMLMDAPQDGNPVSQDNLVEGKTYYISAKLLIDKDGNPETKNNTISVLSQAVTFTKRPLSECSAYLVTPNPNYDPAVEDSKETIETPLEIVKGEGDSYSVTIPAGKFTYNSEAQTPVIKLVNSGNEEVLVTGTDYSASGDSSKTDAGDYTFKLTAAEGSRYSSELTINWTIDQFDVSNYILVYPNTNKDTDNDGDFDSIDAIVYDGAALDGTDYIVSTNEAYTKLDANSPVKALVDEYISQLKGTPADGETPAVPAKTVVTVEAANAGEYPKSEYGYPKENTFLVTPKEENSSNYYYSVGLRKSDNTFAEDDDIIIMPKANDNDASVEFKTFDNSEQDTVIYVYSDGRIGYRPINNNTPTLVNATLPNTTEYGWYIEKTGTRVLNQGTDNVKTVNVFTISAKKYPTGELKNAGEHKAKVTVKNSNFKDITQDINTTIAKRNVTLTPDADQKITYRDTEMPDLTYSIEEAKADGLTGVIEADKALFQKTIGEGETAVTKNAGAIYVDALVQAEAEANAVYFAYAAGENNAKDYTKALLNNAGSYTYAAFDFDNYVVVFPEEDAPTFTVAPLDISTIKDLNIVLNGGDGWTQDGNGGYYQYDGTTKQVSVASVSTANVESESFYAEDLTLSNNSNSYSCTKNNVTVQCSAKSESSGEPINVDGENNVIITIPDGTAISSVELQVASDGTYTINGTEYVVNDWKITLPAAAFTNGNTISSTSSTRLLIDSITVNYSSPDGYVLTAGEDFTVAGATSKASAGTFDVQVVGKGNYTGVATADWAITSDNFVPAGLVLNFAGSNIEDAKKYYDGKAVTAEIYCIDPDDTRFYDYYDNITEAEIKYYNVIRTDNDQVTEVLLESAPKDAGEYKAVATIKAENYAAQEITKKFSIYKAPLTVKAHKKNMFITYGNDLPAVTKADIDSIEGLSDEDKAYLEAFLKQGKLKFAYVDEAKTKVQITPSLTPGDTTEDENEQYRKLRMNYNFENYYWNVIHRAKSLNDSSITVEMPSTVILSENGTASPDSIKVYDTAILNENNEPTELTPGEDYTLNIEETAKAGTYTVEIVGKGEHYRGTRKAEFKAVAEEAVAVSAKTTLGNAANKQLRLTVNAETENKELVTKTGVIVYRGATVPAAGLTIESAAANSDIYDFNSNGTAYTTLVKDSKGGVHYVGYTVLANGTVKYTDVISTSIDVVPKAQTTLGNAANKQLRLTVNADTEYSGMVTKTGIIVYRGTTVPSAGLTIDSAAANSDIYDFYSNGTAYTTLVKDSKGGVHYVGYTVLADGTVKYTDVISTSIDVVPKAQTTLGNAANKQLRLTVNADTEYSGMVTKTGIIVYRGTTVPSAGLTIDSAAANSDIYDFYSNGTAYTTLVKDSKGGVHYVGYTVLADGTVKYTDVISTSINNFVS